MWRSRGQPAPSAPGIEVAVRRGSRKPSPRLAVQTERALARGAAKSPLLPHEHDESPEASAVPDPMEIQAHADVARGLVDTERRGDATPIFNRQHRPGSKLKGS